MSAAGTPRAPGPLAGFANSADLGGLPLPRGRQVPAGRVIRANTPERLPDDELHAALSLGFAAVLDLRSAEEVQACPHPLASVPGYRRVPLIDPAAEARVDISRFRTLGEIYSSSLERNATHIAAIFAALAEIPRGCGPVVVSCRAGRDRTGMVAALLLDLVGVDRDVIAAEYARFLGAQAADRRDGEDIRQMLEHVSTAYGSTAGYLSRLGLDDDAVETIRRRLEP